MNDKGIINVHVALISYSTERFEFQIVGPTFISDPRVVVNTADVRDIVYASDDTSSTELMLRALVSSQLRILHGLRPRKDVDMRLSVFVDLGDEQVDALVAEVAAQADSLV